MHNPSLKKGCDPRAGRYTQAGDQEPGQGGRASRNPDLIQGRDPAGVKNEFSVK